MTLALYSGSILIAGIAVALWISPVPPRFARSGTEAVKIGLDRLDSEYAINPDLLPDRQGRAELLHAAYDEMLYLVDEQSLSDFALFSLHRIADQFRDRYYWRVLVSAFDNYGGEYTSRDSQYYLDADTGELFTEFSPALLE